MIPRDAPALSARLVWLFVFLAHVALAGFALRLLPHGFPIFHPRSVLGTLAPSCIALGSLALAVVLVVAPRAGGRFVPAIPAFWAGAALGLLLVFPATGSLAARSTGALALVLSVAAWLTCRKYGPRELMPAVVLGAASGLVVARCERPSPPSTQPSPEAPPREHGSATEVPASLELGPGLVVQCIPLGVTWQGRRASIFIAPELEFSRTPPDGFWAIFTAETGRAPPVATVTIAPDELRFWAVDGTERLQVERAGGLVRLDAWMVLERPVYSHLNSFTTVEIKGHQRLGLRFSPCPSAVIEVTHADYPAGAPARFAYVDAARRFHVVQAADAEKGPFTAIAEGRLRADETLAIDLIELDDGARTFARLEFLDFAAELSTALSPTAGYGVTENAIEFGLAAVYPSSRAHLLLNLAASGVGRGWDSVGHRAGVYRNRVILRSFEPLPVPVPEPLLDDATIRACTDIAREIAALSRHFPALSAFDPTRVTLREGECSLDYTYRTHPSTTRVGWRAQVPEPDPDGVWFHIGIWDPQSAAARSQLNTQPGFSVSAFGDKNITVLILDGSKHGRLADALGALLRRHGLGELRR